MLRYFASRLVQAVVAVFAVVLVTFGLFKLVPGDPTINILGSRATPEARAALSERLGLNDDIFTQFFRYSTRVLTGDWGVSNKSGQDVGEILMSRAGSTAALVVSGAVLAVVAALVLAIVTATRQNGRLDHSVRILTLVGLFLPTFWIGYVLIRTVAIPTGWFPVSGLSTASPGEFIRSLVLPSVTLAIGLTPVLLRSLRSSMIATLNSEHVAAARTLGLSPARIMRRHVFRNSVTPTINLLATALGFLLFGVVVLETTFDIPGLGSALVSAAAQRDIPVLQGVTVVFAIAVVVVNLLGDLATALLDPRVKLS
ncbi:MAG TPA: ABC transporter permease [Microbacterium sp.]|uniref:ABC transporter permease n=1 Tax=Microbacterium sp. TaxID=51671 RepID=UPI002CBA034C|nr:ABC transporter permease [Microbacterium sp.]HWI32293.1 ABC transporter permease [Microbacterium sp.]